MTDPEKHFFITVDEEFAGTRLDKALANLLPGHSRAAIQQWLAQGRVRADGVALKQKLKLKGGEQLEIHIPEPEPADWIAQQMELEIVHQDEDIFVINKPAGLVVHPGAGNADGTLLNGLLHLDDSLRLLPRAGIVHRLDKDTSGLLVVARNENARQGLIAQLQDRSMHREYVAVVHGVPVSGETIDQPIGRNRHDRLRMGVTASGKPAITHVRIAEKYRHHSQIRAMLETGRTHQIRVHLSWRGFPLVGDPLYGGRVRLPPGASDDLVETLRGFGRQALHAETLSLLHPASGKGCSWVQPLPDDISRLIEKLQRDSRRHT